MGPYDLGSKSLGFRVRTDRWRGKKKNEIGGKRRRAKRRKKKGRRRISFKATPESLERANVMRGGKKRACAAASRACVQQQLLSGDVRFYLFIFHAHGSENRRRTEQSRVQKARKREKQARSQRRSVCAALHVLGKRGNRGRGGFRLMQRCCWWRGRRHNKQTKKGAWMPFFSSTLGQGVRGKGEEEGGQGNGAWWPGRWSPWLLLVHTGIRFQKHIQKYIQDSDTASRQ